MEIKFASLKEIKEFILMIDIYQFCDKQEKWVWHGYKISNRYFDLELEEEGNEIKDPSESRVVRRGHFYCISTPYYKQISWLYKTLETLTGSNNEMLRDWFHVCCERFFLRHPDHSAKELMLYIINSLQKHLNI